MSCLVGCPILQKIALNLGKELRLEFQNRGERLGDGNLLLHTLVAGTQLDHAVRKVAGADGEANRGPDEVGFGNAVAAVSAVPTAYELIMRQLTAKDVIERELTVTGATVTARKDIDLAFAG